MVARMFDDLDVDNDGKLVRNNITGFMLVVDDDEMMLTLCAS